MEIRTAISSIHSLADSWVRLEEVRRLPKALLLSFGIYKGRRGRRIGAWQIYCKGVHEATITDWDGGGLALYPSSHPAAREHTARQAKVQWDGPDDVLIVGALYTAHRAVAGDWIPFDSNSNIHETAKNKFVCRGPEFLMRAYAKALRSIGKQPRLTLRPKSRKASRPKVLHFGDSYVIADAFIAERCSEKIRD